MQALGSRRQFDHEAQADAACPSHVLLANLNRLAGTDELDILHGDTLDDYLCALPASSLEPIPPLMVERLIRMRALEYARLCDMYLAVIAATVQDCEQAAFPRLADKIKERFPRLPICVLLDNLYANQNVFRLCQKNRWHWIITFKSGRLPTAYREFHTLKALCPENVLETRVNRRYQRLSWVSDLEHEEHRFTAFDCLTYNDDLEPTYFAWITDLPVSVRTVTKLANHGGRKRWTIENQGFNNQKHQGYELEHAYSDNNNAIKNYYFILQIAHAIVQLLIYGRLAAAFKSAIGSMKNFFRRLADSLRHQPIPTQAVCPQALGRIQIRLAPT